MSTSFVLRGRQSHTFYPSSEYCRNSARHRRRVLDPAKAVLGDLARRAKLDRVTLVDASKAMDISDVAVLEKLLDHFRDEDGAVAALDPVGHAGLEPGRKIRQKRRALDGAWLATVFSEAAGSPEARRSS